VIGLLSNRAAGEDAHLLAAFRQGLKQSGYVEGQNVAIEYRWADGQYDRLPAMAAELVRHSVAVIAAMAAPSAAAAKAATSKIPIVFESAGDPVAAKLVAGLNRPGGNITGVTTLNSEVAAKRLGLLHDMVPKATRIGHDEVPSPVNGRKKAPRMAEGLKLGVGSAGRGIGERARSSANGEVGSASAAYSSNNPICGRRL
jgi:putative ABC transport system substrate-binding protein